jgi:hypothetical protein
MAETLQVSRVDAESTLTRLPNAAAQFCFVAHGQLSSLIRPGRTREFAETFTWARESRDRAGKTNDIGLSCPSEKCLRDISLLGLPN